MNSTMTKKEIWNWKNQRRLEMTAVEDKLANARRDIIFDSLADGDNVEISVQTDVIHTLHYFGRITKIELESGMNWDEGKDFNVEISSNPGLSIYLNLRKPCVKEWISF